MDLRAASSEDQTEHQSVIHQGECDRLRDLAILALAFAPAVDQGLYGTVPG